MGFSMRPMRKRLGWLGLVLVAGLLIGGALPVRAATALSYDDPAGDALDTRASMDIVKVTYDIRQINKSGPPSLVVELELAGPPEAQLATYDIQSTAGESCFVDAGFRPGTVVTQAGLIPAAQFYLGCNGDNAFVAAKSLIKGNVLTMSIAMDSLPKPIRELGVLSELYAFSMTAEPAVGLYGNGYIDLIGNLPTPTDSATTDQTFKFA